MVNVRVGERLCAGTVTIALVSVIDVVGNTNSEEFMTDMTKREAQAMLAWALLGDRGDKALGALLDAYARGDAKDMELAAIRMPEGRLSALTDRITAMREDLKPLQEVMLAAVETQRRLNANSQRATVDWSNSLSSKIERPRTNRRKLVT